MGRARFTADDFLYAALAIAAERGPTAVTVGSVTKRLNAPTGSFYHRFASRDLLLAQLRLRILTDFQRGVSTALAAGDPLRAALHIPSWAREHLDEARLLLLYDRDEFSQGGWPEAAREAMAAQSERMQEGVAAFAGMAFGRAQAEDLRRAQFLLQELPAAAVIPYLRRREPPPPTVDELIATTYRAIVDAYRAV